MVSCYLDKFSNGDFLRFWYTHHPGSAHLTQCVVRIHSHIPRSTRVLTSWRTPLTQPSGEERWAGIGPYRASWALVRGLNPVLVLMGNHRMVVFFFFLRRSFALSALQAGAQWLHLCSLQPLPPGFTRFSCFTLLCSWDHRRVPPHLAFFMCF